MTDKDEVGADAKEGPVVVVAEFEVARSVDGGVFPSFAKSCLRLSLRICALSRSFSSKETAALVFAFLEPC